MRIKVKRTGVEWEVDEKSPTGIRVKEQPEDYEILDGVVPAEPEVKKTGKGSK